MPFSNENRDACSTVVNYVCERIAAGELNIGDKLPPERELAANLDVSRSAVREAIKVLAYEGMIDSTQGSGNYVSDKYFKTVTRIMSIMYQRGDVDNRALASFRTMLEKQAFIEAVDTVDDSQIQKMQQLVNLLDTCTDPELEFSLDMWLHTLLIEASGNILLRINFAALSAVTKKYMAHVYFSNVTKVSDGYAKLQQFHHRIVDCLAAGDLSNGLQAIDEHFAFVGF